MMRLVPTTPWAVLDLEGFNLPGEYLDPSIHGSEYSTDDFQWYEAVDVNLKEPVVAVLCLTTNRVLPSSVHVSVFEVKSSMRGRGIGTMVMERLLSDCEGLCRVVTLRPRNEGLIDFYGRLGFRTTIIDGQTLMRKYLSFTN